MEESGMLQHAHKFDELFMTDFEKYTRQNSRGARRVAEIFYAASSSDINSSGRGLAKGSSKMIVGSFCCQL